MVAEPVLLLNPRTCCSRMTVPYDPVVSGGYLVCVCSARPVLLSLSEVVSENAGLLDLQHGEVLTLLGVISGSRDSRKYARPRSF